MSKFNKVVLFFGVFDPIHEGHREAFAQAKALGDYLLVVVARDASIREQKKHEPHLLEDERLAQVAAEVLVDEARLGEEDSGSYRLLDELGFDVLALGYDQRPGDTEVREILDRAGKGEVEVVRLKPFYPERFKSSLFR